MRHLLNKAIQTSQWIDMVYLSEKGQITKRRIKIFKMDDTFIYAFCFLRQSRRLFKVDNILALEPVYVKGKVVV